MGYESIWAKPSPENGFLKLLEKHYAALLGTPAAAAMADRTLHFFFPRGCNFPLSVMGKDRKTA